MSIQVRNEAFKGAGLWLVLQGAPLTLSGLLVLLWPGTALPALVALLVAHALIEAAGRALDRARPRSRRSAWAQTGALASPAAATLALLWPDLAALAVPLAAGIGTLLLGVAALLDRMRSWPRRFAAGLLAAGAGRSMVVLLSRLGLRRLLAACAVVSGLLLSASGRKLRQGILR